MIFVPAVLNPFSTLRSIRKATFVRSVESLMPPRKLPLKPNNLDSGHE